MTDKRLRPTKRKPKGQSALEFSLVGVLLFTLLLGLIDVGRLLFTYSVVSNAAQEGVHYGIVRPRDVLDYVDATRVAANVTLTPAADRHTYIQAQIVPTPGVVTGSLPCNIFEKTRSSAYGLTQPNVNVAVWYDGGDGTPVPVTTPQDLETAAAPGKRVVVEATYHFDFIVPFLSIFRPNGINVKMRSARTILSRGDDPSYVCAADYTPAPTYTPSNTPTRTYTPTSTSTRTVTPTATATPNCGINNASACRMGNAAREHWQAQATIRGYVAGDTVTAFLTGGARGGVMTCDALGNCSFQTAAAADRATAGDTVTITLSGACQTTTLIVAFGPTCGTSTATPTPTPTP